MPATTPTTSWTVRLRARRNGETFQYRVDVASPADQAREAAILEARKLAAAATNRPDWAFVLQRATLENAGT